MSLSTDERSLMALARTILLAAKVEPGPSCSAGLAELLRRHHLRSLADQFGAGGLEHARGESAVLAAFHRRSLEEIGRAFHARAIAWTAIKGAAYAWRLYDDPSLRPMSDLDVLVKAADFEAASLCLKQCGYRPRAVSTRTRHAQTFYRAPHEIVDLHRSILQPMRGNADLSRVWERAQPSTSLPGYLDLDMVDLCCVHIAHTARHEFVVPLVSYVDLQRLLGGFSESQNHQLEQELHRWHLDYALEVCREVIKDIVSGRPSTGRTARMRCVVPSISELVACSHRSRYAQITKKLVLFPRDAVALGMGWALRSVEDRLIRGR